MVTKEFISWENPQTSQSPPNAIGSQYASHVIGNISKCGHINWKYIRLHQSLEIFNVISKNCPLHNSWIPSIIPFPITCSQQQYINHIIVSLYECAFECDVPCNVITIRPHSHLSQ